MEQESIKTVLKKWFKYAIIVILVLISISFVFNSSSPIVAASATILIWWIGSWLFRRREYIKAWGESEEPLLDYMKKHREQREQAVTEFKEREIITSREKTLDSEAFAPLSELEDKRWQEIIAQLNKEDN